MKQTKKAGNKPAPKQAKPKLVKKAKPSAKEEIDVFMADLPKRLTRRLYFNMAMSNLKNWLKTFF